MNHPLFVPVLLACTLLGGQPARADQPAPTPTPLRISLLGDSLSIGFHLDSAAQLLWQMNTDPHGGGWFNDQDPSPESPFSLGERGLKNHVLELNNHATAAAYIDGVNLPAAPVKEAIGNISSLADQVDALLAQKTLPDVVFIWIGHNNVDWKTSFDAEGATDPKSYISALAVRLGLGLSRELNRIVERASQEKHGTRIVVLGLIGFESFFKARDKAENLRTTVPYAFPYFDQGYELFPSMKPLYRKNMIQLANLTNAEFKKIAESVQASLTASAMPVSVTYSDALTQVNISSILSIHPKDAWHPSVKGHNALAEAMQKELEAIVKTTPAPTNP